jgi:hypothetical protein
MKKFIFSFLVMSLSSQLFAQPKGKSMVSLKLEWDSKTKKLICRVHNEHPKDVYLWLESTDTRSPNGVHLEFKKPKASQVLESGVINPISDAVVTMDIMPKTQSIKVGPGQQSSLEFGPLNFSSEETLNLGTAVYRMKDLKGATAQAHVSWSMKAADNNKKAAPSSGLQASHYNRYSDANFLSSQTVVLD